MQRKTKPMMDDEFSRLSGFYSSSHLSKVHRERPFPSRRSAKHPSVGQVFKTSRIISMSVETQPFQRNFR